MSWRIWPKHLPRSSPVQIYWIQLEGGQSRSPSSTGTFAFTTQRSSSFQVYSNLQSSASITCLYSRRSRTFAQDEVTICPSSLTWIHAFLKAALRIKVFVSRTATKVHLTIIWYIIISHDRWCMLASCPILAKQQPVNRHFVNSPWVPYSMWAISSCATLGNSSASSYARNCRDHPWDSEIILMITCG